MGFDLSAPECDLLNRLLTKYRDLMADVGAIEAAELAGGLLHKLNHPTLGVDQPDEALYSGIGESISPDIPIEERLALGNANAE